MLKIVKYWLKNTRPPSQKGNSTILWQAKRVFAFEFSVRLHRIRTVIYYKAKGDAIYFSNLDSNWITAFIKKRPIIPLKQGKA